MWKSKNLSRFYVKLLLGKFWVWISSCCLEFKPCKFLKHTYIYSRNGSFWVCKITEIKFAKNWFHIKLGVEKFLGFPHCEYKALLIRMHEFSPEYYLFQLEEALIVFS